HVKELKLQLLLLNDDQYLIDKKSPLIKIYGEDKVNDLMKMGVRHDKSGIKSALISSRKTLLELLDLSLSFSLEDRLIIYKIAKTKRLGLAHLVDILVNKYNQPLNENMDSKALEQRFTRSWTLIAKIDKKINKFENDLVMREIDPEYLDSQLKH